MCSPGVTTLVILPPVEQSLQEWLEALPKGGATDVTARATDLSVAVLSDGRYVLEVPYSDDRELLMDILKFGADVQVLAPAALRGKVRDRLKAAAKRY